MASCLIGKGAGFNCADIKPGGIKQSAWLYNYAQWRAMVTAGLVVFDAVGRVTSITNAVGVAAYVFEVPDETGIVPGQELVVQEGNVDMWKHLLKLSVVLTDQEDIRNVDVMRVQKMVAIIIRNDGKGMNYGAAQGMRLTANNFNPQDAVLGTILPIELATSDAGAKEPYAPGIVYDTDEATTLAMITGLTVEGVV